MSSGEQPLVSIGMPLYNAEQYLRLALNSLLAQDYPHFELILSDNGSTDGTADICQEYAARDGRIRFYGAGENRGAAWNFKRVFELATGPYFMWAAHDDQWDSNYVSACLAGLNAHPDAVLCCSAIDFVDEHGGPVDRRHPNLDTRGMDLLTRIRSLMRQEGWFAIYGLIRSSALERVKLGKAIWGSDVVILLELLLMGETMRTDSTRFQYRIVYKSVSDSLLSVDPDRVDEACDSPYWDMVNNLVRTVLQSEQSVFHKASITATIFNEALRPETHLGSIIKDELFRQYFVPRHSSTRLRTIITFWATLFSHPQLVSNWGVWTLLCRRLALGGRAGT